MKMIVGSAVCAAVIASTALAQEPVKLRYKFKEGEKLAYALDQKMKMAMNVNGMDIDTKMNMKMEMSWNVVSVNREGGAQLQIKVNQVQLSMEAPNVNVEVDSKQKNEPDDQIGKIFYQIAKATATMEMTGTMLPTGEMKDVKVSEESLKALKNLPGADKVGDMLSPESFKSMVSNLVFPTEAVSKGKTWTNKSEIKTQMGKTVSDNTYTFDGPVQKDGVTLEKISIKPDVKIEPDPKAQFKVELKDSKGSGQILFDNKSGRMVESNVNQVMQMQIGVGGLNFNQTMDTNVTMRLKK